MKSIGPTEGVPGRGGLRPITGEHSLIPEKVLEVVEPKRHVQPNARDRESGKQCHPNGPARKYDQPLGLIFFRDLVSLQRTMCSQLPANLVDGAALRH